MSEVSEDRRQRPSRDLDNAVAIGFTGLQPGNDCPSFAKALPRSTSER
jgi:hypothetical protein